MTKKDLLIATKNLGKVRELERLLAGVPVNLRNLNEFPSVAEPAETGSTFRENAVLKALYYAAQTNVRALADDSGLAVEALGGAPGVLSARYAGENASDAERTEKLLEELREKAAVDRRAEFVCAMAIADAQGEILVCVEGVCRGRIAFQPAGKHGFGYDPVFVPEGFSETFGELPSGVKHEISHRARASAKIIAFLRGFIVG